MPDNNQLLWDMWFGVWGNTLLGCLVILGFFGFLCYRKKLDVGSGAIVMFPVLFGIVACEFMPLWVQGLFLLGLGFLWGMTILKILGLKWS